MSEDKQVSKVEMIARKAAEQINGGKFYDENFYKFDHRIRWIEVVELVIRELEEDDE